MKVNLAYDHLADANHVEVCGEIVSFPIVRGSGEQAHDISVDEYIQLAWKSVLDTAASYGLTGEAKYHYYFFPNSPQKFKNAFYYTFHNDTDAADKAFAFFSAATSNPDTTSNSRRKMKGSPSSSHYHVILKAILFLTKVMFEANGKHEFYPMVILDIYDNPTPVIEKAGVWYKLVKVNGAMVERPLTREEQARKMHTFIAFSQIFTQLIKQNRVQEYGSWNGLPSRLYALGEMIKVRQIQYKRTVQITHNLTRRLELEHGSTEGLKSRISKMMEEATLLNQRYKELLAKNEQQKTEIERLKSANQQWQQSQQRSVTQLAELKEQASTQLSQKERAYTQALRKKEDEFAQTVAQKESANQLLVKEIKENRAKISELESSIESLQSSPPKDTSSLQKSQFNLLQSTNQRLTTQIQDQQGLIGDQTKAISELTIQVSSLKRDKDILSALSEKLEAENGVLVRALQSFFEFMMSWFKAAPLTLNDCLNVEGVPNAAEGITFGQALQPKMREVTSLLKVHGVTTSFAAAEAEAQANQTESGAQLFQDMQLK